MAIRKVFDGPDTGARICSALNAINAATVLAQRASLRLDEAFQVMRAYARSHNRQLSDVAAQIIDGTLDDNQVRKSPRPKPSAPPQA
ncbi:ANTAR domain-containing protein [Kibdelosporangium aridum]|uniref:ANTAR domain-containing protein n=1 Tax=Kibdelosporangium aridum TaxID=2030 RepID=UPI0035E7A4D3